MKNDATDPIFYWHHIITSKFRRPKDTDHKSYSKKENLNSVRLNAKNSTGLGGKGKGKDRRRHEWMFGVWCPKILEKRNRDQDDSGEV